MYGLTWFYISFLLRQGARVVKSFTGTTPRVSKVDTPH